MQTATLPRLTASALRQGHAQVTEGRESGRSRAAFPAVRATRGPREGWS